MDEDFRLEQTIKSVHNTMTDCRSELKNRAALKNLTDLKAIIHNKTKWSSKGEMLKRYNRIYKVLI